jgi:cold shock CspA family protein
MKSICLIASHTPTKEKQDALRKLVRVLKKEQKDILRKAFNDMNPDDQLVFLKKAYKLGVKQKDMFAHYSDIINQDGFKSLYKDQDVRFDVGVNAHGDPKAVNIELIR